MSDSPITLRGRGGGVVFQGTQSPGGGSMPVQATYSGNFVDVANNTQASLSWDNLLVGDDLLDRTAPKTPVFLETGTYAVSILVDTSGFDFSTGFLNVVLGLAENDPLCFASGQLAAEFGLSLSQTVIVTDISQEIFLPVRNVNGGEAAQVELAGAIIVKLA